MAAKQEVLPPKTEHELFMDRSVGDPLYFVMGAFEWGEGDLKPTVYDPNPGPDEWQIKMLNLIAENHLQVPETLKLAMASGNGPGKTAFIAFIVIWWVCTKPDCSGTITANTKVQLETKTWREVGLWYRRLIPPLRELYDISATKIFRIGRERQWAIHAIPWSAENPDAFAGQHSEWALMIFDEASNIEKPIWEAAETCMTTPHGLWIVFGNPWRNSGGFYDCFHAQRHRWHHYQIDSRTAKRANKREIQKWIDDHGEDSDYVRIHVRGVFPKSGTFQLIGADVIEAAQARFKECGRLDETGAHPSKFGAKLLGVDVARFGSDSSTIWFRQGRYAHRLLKANGLDTMQLAARVAEFIKELKPQAVFVDGGGVGGGVIDRLHQMGFVESVMEVNSGTKAIDPVAYGNLRIEMWDKMGKWLVTGTIEDDLDMRTDLGTPEYFFDRSNRKMLESKDDMRARGLSSPDDADALANTFAMPIAEAEPMNDRYARMHDRYGKKGTGRKGSSMAA